MSDTNKEKELDMIRQAFGNSDYRMTKPVANKPILDKRRRLLPWLAAALVVSLALTIYFGINTIQGTDQSILLNIDSSSEVVAGKQVSYTIHYQNEDKVPMTQLSLSIIYPDGFTFQSASTVPANDGKNYWELPDLPARTASAIQVNGYLIGEQGENKNIKVELAYEPANFSSTFVAAAEFSQTITDLAVDMWADAPSEALPGESIGLKIHILNHQTDNWQPLAVELTLPDQIMLLDADPAIESDNLIPTWHIDSLDPEQEKIIMLRAEIIDGITLDRLIWHLQLWSGLDKDKRILLDDDSAQIDIAKPQVVASLALADDKNLINWGDIINYQLKITNTGEYTLHDATLSLLLDSDFINWQNWQASTGMRREDNKVIWTTDHPKVGDKLKNFAPGDEINIKIGAKLQNKPIDANTLTSADLLVRSVAKLSVPIGQGEYVSASDTITVQIGQLLSLTMRPYYYDGSGQAVGSGAMPPQVGLPTVYIIDWQLAVGPQDLQSISLSSSLPPGVDWVGSSGDASVEINNLTKEISLSFDNLSASSVLAGSWQVQLKPEADDVGQWPILLNPWHMQANAGEVVWQGQTDAINSRLLTDSKAANNDKVIK
ncbi:MAG: hypothetical protein ACKKL5_02565 [Candidatus Komeilibacteria bacterium]